MFQCGLFMNIPVKFLVSTNVSIKVQRSILFLTVYEYISTETFLNVFSFICFGYSLSTAGHGLQPIRADIRRGAGYTQDKLLVCCRTNTEAKHSHAHSFLWVIYGDQLTQSSCSWIGNQSIWRKSTQALREHTNSAQKSSS